MADRNPGPLPNRWLHCPRKSEMLIAQKFLAFKTPLSKAYIPKMPLECIFTPEMLFDYCKTLKLKLGLWINLTSTDRYYHRSVVEDRGAKFIKLQCRGHGETPSPEQTKSFIKLVSDFINEHPFETIAVHCTHGYNRTGFLIVSYLVERLDCSLDAALSVFAQARPPGIYKQDYILELYRRYDNIEDAIQAPPLPNWYLECDDSDRDQQSNPTYYDMASTSGEGQHKRSNDSDYAEDKLGENSGKGGANGGNRKKRRRELVIENATFMEGVSGVHLVADKDKLSELQLVVQEMCNWENNGFPGCQPVSMDQNNLEYLHKYPYRVSWKADGVRYMMLIRRKNEVYFIDKNNSVFEIDNITFPSVGNLEEHLENTLLDGEMVLDQFEGKMIPRFLVYDIVKFANDNIGSKPFYPDRLECIREKIIQPRHVAICRGLIDKFREPFSVRNKEFWDINTSASLLGEKFAKQLSHKPDGLIFQPSLDHYIPGVCPKVLKWKPSEMNSVDFRLKIVTECGVGILPRKIGLLFVGGTDHHYATIKYTKELKNMDNKIIECSRNNQNQWKFMRERTDKTMPNSFNTAEAVMKSITRPVTEEYLLNYITKYGYIDDKSMMPPQKPIPQEQRTPQQVFIREQHHSMQKRDGPL